MRFSRSIVSAIVFLYLSTATNYALSAPTDRVYAQQVVSFKNQGGYMSLVLGQEDLYNNSTSTNIIGSINKELWLGIDPAPLPGEPPYCWFEAGQKKGGVLKDLSQSDDMINPQQINWSGHFLGYSLWDTVKNKFVFYATPYGAISPTG
jgi:hypothetical protein